MCIVSLHCKQAIQSKTQAYIAVKIQDGRQMYNVSLQIPHFCKSTEKLTTTQLCGIYNNKFNC